MGTFIRLVDYKSSDEKEAAFLLIENQFLSNSHVFLEIPGSPFAYWVNENVRKNFAESNFAEEFDIKAGICTGENETFIKYWYELDFSYSSLFTADYRYVPHNKGGEYRKWYGNHEFFLKYNQRDLKKMESNKGYRHDGKDYYFRNHVGWSKISSSRYSFRYYDDKFTFDSAGLGLFPINPTGSILWALGFLNSSVATYFINLLNPTLNVTPMVVKNLPLLLGMDEKREIEEVVEENVAISKAEWDERETSWEFKRHPLL